MHTQGTWQQTGRIIHCENGNICSLADPRASDFVSFEPVQIGSPDWQEAMDNGKLIKAAPLLLAACEKSLHLLGIHGLEDTDTGRDLHTAIATAKGES